MVQELVLHVRFEGRSLDVGLAVLDVGALSTDQDIRQAVARYQAE